MRSIALLAACFLTACATAKADERPFTALGEVALYDRIVTFDDTSVRAADFQLSTADGKEWAGRVEGGLLYLTVDGDSIRGPNVVMQRTLGPDGAFTLTGQRDGRFFRVELNRDGATLNSGTGGNQLQGRELGRQLVTFGTEGTLGQAGLLQLKGQAAEYRWPQVALALFAVTPR